MTLDTAYVTPVDARALRPAEFVVLLHDSTFSPPASTFSDDCSVRASVRAAKTYPSPRRAPQFDDRASRVRLCRDGRESARILTLPRVVTQDRFSSEVEVEVEVEVARDGTDVRLSAARQCVRNGERK